MTDQQPSPSPSPAPAAPAAGQPPQTPPPAASRRGGIVGQIIMVMVVLIICGAGALLWSYYESNRKVQANQAHEMPPQEVDYFLVRKNSAPVVLEYLGQTAFSQSVDIRARVKGFLETRSFEEGGRIKKGQQLFTIERATFAASLEAAKAQLAQAQARHQQAIREVARLSELLARNAASQRELDDWKTNVEVYAADIEAARASIKQAELDLNYTVITSPLDGVISQSFQDVGNYVGDSSNESLLATVGQDHPIYVEFPVTEQDLLRWRSLTKFDTLQEATEQSIRVQALLTTGQTYPALGKLNYVDTKINPATGSATIRAVFENPEHFLKPGQFIRVKIVGLQQDNVVTIPQRAVIQMPTGASVYVVDEDNTAQIRPVTLGRWINDLWVIENGLDEGDKVIVNRLMHLTPGTKVIAKPVTDDAGKTNNTNTTSNAPVTPQ